jgi:hypothetical protein
MVQFTLPKNSKITAGKTWTWPAGPRNGSALSQEPFFAKPLLQPLAPTFERPMDRGR